MLYSKCNYENIASFRNMWHVASGGGASVVWLVHSNAACCSHLHRGGTWVKRWGLPRFGNLNAAILELKSIKELKITYYSFYLLCKVVLKFLQPILGKPIPPPSSRRPHGSPGFLDLAHFQDARKLHNSPLLALFSMRSCHFHSCQEQEQQSKHSPLSATTSFPEILTGFLFNTHTRGWQYNSVRPRVLSTRRCCWHRRIDCFSKTKNV